MLIFWREMVIGTLLVALAALSQMYLGKRDEVATLTVRIADGQRAAKEIADRSNRALDTLRAEHQRNSKEIERNAWIIFKRRYPQYAGCLQPQPTVPDQPTASDSSGSSYEPGKEFVVGCASDAGRIAEFQRWIRLNKFPVEGE